MSKQKEKKLVPKLRFPEFQNAGAWDEPTLGKISDRIEEKVGSLKLTTVSITAGSGFVSQAEKFSRDISGKQYKNYILLNEGEFAYNKGNSKKFPQGCIYKLKEFKKVAAPNAFICFRIKNKFVSDFYQGYFDNNYHGIQLQKFITSGARMDGLLNISPSDFFSIIFPTPKDRKEQQKIADCLSSLDDLINAHSQKLDALKAYKKGLLQQLFPAEGETIPKLRFPEFQNDGEWEEKELWKVGEIVTGKTPSTSDESLWGGDVQFVTPTDITEEKYQWKTQRSVVENSRIKVIPKCSTMFTCIASIGKMSLSVLPCITNQQINTLIPKSDYESEFVYYSLLSITPLIKSTQANSTLPIINKTEFSKFAIPVPCNKLEQQKIADCLSSVDKLVTAQGQKLDSLKDHKKGLMQQLFPSVDEEGA